MSTYTILPKDDSNLGVTVISDDQSQVIVVDSATQEVTVTENVISVSVTPGLIGSLTVDSVNGKTGLVVLNADDISETSDPAGNKYYTASRDTAQFNIDLALKTTDDLTEGSTNEYYTDAKARAALTGAGDINYNQTTGVISFDSSSLVTSVNGQDGAVVLSTTNIAEGTNKYWTQVRFDDALHASDTDDLNEGNVNLYYTDVRAQTVITANTEQFIKADSTETLTNKSGNISQWQNDSDYVTHVNGIEGPSAVLDTDNIQEDTSPTNKWFTEARARASVSVNDTGGDGSLSYNNTTGVFTFTGPAPSDVRVLLDANYAGGDGNFTYDNTTGIFTYTGPSAAEVRAHFSEGDGIDINAGVISIETDGVDSTHIDFGTGANQVSTADLPENTNLYYTDNRADARVDLQTGANLDLSSKDTDDLAEGSNLYYTDGRARLSLTVTDNGGDGSITYNSATGVIDYTGPNQTEVRNHITRAFVDALGITATGVDADSVALGTDTTGDYVESITGTANKIEVSGSGTEGRPVTLTLPSTVQIAQDLTVGGNLTVNGDLTYLNTTDLQIQDNLFELNAGLTGAPTNDSGMLVQRGTETNQIFMWDESVDKFTLGATASEEGARGNISVTVGTLVANIEGNVTGDLTGDSSGTHTGAVIGDVTGDVLGNVTGNLTGDSSGTHTGPVTGTTVTASSGFQGSLVGQVTGNVIGDVTGDLSGDVTGKITSTGTGAQKSVFTEVDINGGTIDGTPIGGNVASTGEFTTVSTTGGITANTGFDGDLTGDVTGNTTGHHYGDVTGNLSGSVTGNVQGNTEGDLTGDVYAGNGTSKILENGTNGTDAVFTGNVTGNVTGTVSTLSNHDTGDLAEGSNQYYTDAKVLTKINNTSIDGLSDVDTSTTAPTTAQVLEWDGTNWVPGDSGIGDVTQTGTQTLSNKTLTVPKIDFIAPITSGEPVLIDKIKSSPGNTGQINPSNYGGQLDAITTSATISSDRHQFPTIPTGGNPSSYPGFGWATQLAAREGQTGSNPWLDKAIVEVSLTREPVSGLSTTEFLSAKALYEGGFSTKTINKTLAPNTGSYYNIRPKSTDGHLSELTLTGSSASTNALSPQSDSNWQYNRLKSTTNGTILANLDIDGSAISFYGNEYRLPNTDGTSGQVLYTDGNGNISWTAAVGTVSNVNGLTGAVVLDTDDINEDANPTNLYFTDARVETKLNNTDLDELQDVVYTSAPQAGEVLLWDDTVYPNGAWRPNVVSGTGTVTSITAGDHLNVATTAPPGGTITGAGTLDVVTGGASGIVALDQFSRLPAVDGSQLHSLPDSGVQSITASTGLTGGTITGTGTIAVDVGTTAGKIVQIDGNGKLPNVDGSQLTNLPPTGVQSITPGVGLYNYSGGTGVPITGSGSIGVNVGSAAAGYADRICQFDSSGRLPAVDGSQLTNLPSSAAQTLSFSSPDLTLSGGGGTVDLSSLTPNSLPWGSITSTPTTIAGYGITDAFDGAYSSLTGLPTLFSGAYADLSGKPTLFSGAYADLSGKPTLSTVAGTGDYSDLLNKPTLFDGAFSSLTGTPTTISGYGITDGVTLTGTETLTNKTIPAFTGNEIKYIANSGSGNNFQALKIVNEYDSTLTPDYSNFNGAFQIQNYTQASSEWINVLQFQTPNKKNMFRLNIDNTDFVDNDGNVTSKETAAGSFVTGNTYKIVSVGTTDFTTIGSADNNVNTIFVATGAGSGTGTADAWDTGSHFSTFSMKGADNIGFTKASDGLVVGVKYKIFTVGTTDFTAVGSADNNVGTEFECDATGSSGTGVAVDMRPFKGQKNRFSSYTAHQSPNVWPTNLDFDANTISFHDSYVFPTTDGSSGQILTTDGAGQLSFTSPSGTGTVTSVDSGTGLTGGPITGSGTLNVDVGTTANKIVQLDSNAKLPAVDGSNLTNLPSGAAQTLSFTSPNLTISGSSSTVDLSALSTTSLAWSALTATPTTIAGYGITDAFDGNYNNLTNKPTLFSGAYADLTGKPTIPTNNNQLTNGAGYISSVPAQSFASLTGKPTTISGYGITDAFDGAYSSLSGLPTLYDNADVDTHLNTSTAATNEVLSWNGTDYDWVAQTGGGGGSTTINNNADNRIITGSNTANTLNGQGDLTYDGDHLLIEGTASAPDDAVVNIKTDNSLWSKPQLTLEDSSGKAVALLGQNDPNLDLDKLVFMMDPEGNHNHTNAYTGDYGFYYTKDWTDLASGGNVTMRNRIFGAEDHFTTSVFGDYSSAVNGQYQYRPFHLNTQKFKVMVSDGSNNLSEAFRVEDGTIRFHEEYIFPQTDGSANQILTTDGVGQLSFTNVPAQTFSSLTGKPTTIAGYGITDAFDGAYSSLTGKPTIPTNNNELTNGAAYITASSTETLTNKTLTSPVLGGTTTSASGNIVLDPATQIVEIKGDGSSVEGQIKLNCHANTHGQTIKAQPHSANVTNTMLLPTGANSTLVSEATVDGLLDTHLNTSTATTNQVLSWDGTDYDWVTNSGGGGGSSTLSGLTDVDITSVQNNDLLMYNSTAGEWQNTNLGVSVTPTLSGDTTGFAAQSYTFTVSNHATYDDPAYSVEVYTGTTRVVQNSDVTDNGDGTLTFTAPAVGTHEIRVRCQDFGDLQSEIATKALTTTAFSFNYRYFRLLMNSAIQSGTLIKEFGLYTSGSQGGTKWPTSAMTTNSAPTPFVASGQGVYGGTTYNYFKAFDNNTSTSYWNLAGTSNTDFVSIDLGSAQTIQSFKIETQGFVQATCLIQASSTGAWSGEEVDVQEVSLAVNSTFNIG